MQSLHVDYFIHGANIILLVAYCSRDVLWLRLFALSSSIIAIPYFLLQPATLWAPLGWTVIFATVNLVQTCRLIIERRPVRLTKDEERVRKLAFADLSPRQVLQVLSIGSWNVAHAGEQLIRCGQPVASISLIVNGKVRVTRGRRILGDLIPGSLVGSALLLNDVPADVDAVAIEEVQTVRWTVGTLQKFLAANPETRIVMQRHLARDLAEKVERMSGESSTYSQTA